MAKSTGAATSLTSSAAWNGLCEKFLPASTEGLTQHDDAIEAFDAGTSSFRPAARKPSCSFCSVAPPSQETHEDAVHAVEQEGLPLAINRTRALRQSQSLPGAKGCVHCAPFPGLKTHIGSKHLLVWFHYVCQTPSSAPGTPCPKPRCAEMLDIHGGPFTALRLWVGA